MTTKRPPPEARRMTTDSDEDIAIIVHDLTEDEARAHLRYAIQTLRDYPKGQSDGAWRKRRQIQLEYFLPGDQCQ